MMCCVEWVEHFFAKPIVLRGIDGFRYALSRVTAQLKRQLLRSTHPTKMLINL